MPDVYKKTSPSDTEGKTNEHLGPLLRPRLAVDMSGGRTYIQMQGPVASGWYNCVCLPLLRNVRIVTSFHKKTESHDPRLSDLFLPCPLIPCHLHLAGTGRASPPQNPPPQKQIPDRHLQNCPSPNVASSRWSHGCLLPGNPTTGV